MSVEVESRVLEMRFNNKEFEEHAKTSMITLAKLKEALKLPNSSKALEDVGKAAKDIKLDGITAGVEALSQRFSTFGIVGMRVIENITDGLMNKLGQAVNFVTKSIVSGGVKRAMNIENAHFQLQTLLKDESKVQAVMADAMESVDGTAYAYDEAAKAASQFAASGIQAGEEMLGALKGITGVAAMTNSDFESISRIFTTVAGNGRLMGDQLLQLSSRGLNAASTLVDYFKEVRGQSSITEGEIRDMVSKGKISFKDFADAMTWAFGESAKRANETFTGSLSNMKAALARTGAGFFSPLVEQEGELVKLFNALRVQINNINSTLIFDEAKSAISGLSKEAVILDENIGKLVISGEIGFDTITKSVIGASRSEEELSTTNERLMSTFEDMKKAGHATTDMLKVFADEGMNMSYSITKYLNGVQEGSIKASNAMIKSVKEITGGSRAHVQEINELAKEGKISVDIFAAAMATNANLIGKDAEFMGEAVSAMMKKVKNEGHLTMTTMQEFSHSNMNASKAVMDYINGVKDGSIRASYATRTAINEMTEDAIKTTHEINKFVEEGAISFDIFQSAMEHAYGDSKALSKQFTDSFLDMIKMIVNAVENADMTKPMEAFYYWVESGKNVGKGLLSVLKPIARAFKNVFGAIEMDTIVDFSVAVEELTAKMQLSEENSKNLEDAFTGIFDVTKLLIDIFFKLLGAIIPINEPVLEMGDGFLGLIGSMGRALSGFTKTIRESKKVREAYDYICEGVKFVSDGIKELIEWIETFVDEVQEMPIVKSGIKKVTETLTELTNVKNPLARLTEGFKTFRATLKDIDWETQNTGFKKFQEVFQKLLEKAMENEGFAKFVEHVKEFGKEVKEAFSLDSITEKVEKFRTALEKLTEWFKTYVVPTFSDISFGDLVATGGGLGLIYALVKAAKAFTSISNSIKAIPNVFGTISKTLIAYQRDLNASAILKIAAAIAILAAALTVLSFADTERLLQAGFAFSLFAGVLMFAASEFANALKELKKAFSYTKPIDKAMNTFADGLKKTMIKFGEAVKIKAAGSAIKDVAISLAIIAATIVGLGIMYRKDREALSAGVGLVEYLLIIVTGIMVAMSFMGEALQKGTKGFAEAAGGMMFLALTLIIGIKALEKLFKMEIPSDYKEKLGILAALFAGLGVLSIAVGAAGKIAGGQKLSGGTFIGMSALIYLTVTSLKKLFEMKIPDDMGKRLGILAGIFTALAGLMVAIGYASKLSGGNSLKALGTLVGICMALAVAVGALIVLSIFPGDKILKGAVSLGLILVALGAALYGAGKITEKDTYKSVLAMALITAVIVAALGVLSMVKWEKLLKATLSLGAVLLAMSEAFRGAGKASSAENTTAIVAMCIALTTVAIALYKLAEQPWEGLISAGIAMSAVLTVFGETFEKVLSKNWSKNSVKKIGIFLLLTTSLIPIGIALGELANQPWQGMIAAGSAISSVILAFSVAFQAILEKNWSDNNVKKIGTFLAMTLAVLPIGIAMSVLAEQPWQGLIGGATGLSLAVMAMSVAFRVIAGSEDVDLGKIAGFVGASVSLYPIAYVLNQLAGNDWKSLLGAATALSEVLLVMTIVVGLLSKLDIDAGAVLKGAGIIALVIGAIGVILTGVGALFEKFQSLEGYLDKGIEILVKIGNGLGQFVGAIIGGIGEGVTASLPVMTENISNAMTNLQPFIDIVSGTGVNENLIKGAAYIAGAIALITGAEIVSAIGVVLGGSLGLVNMAAQMALFATELQPFLTALNMVKPEAVEACKNIASMIVALTVAQVVNGISSFLGLGTSLTDFGSELIGFGKCMAKFAEHVKYITPEAVSGAAAAATIMAELANKLPAQGGLAGLIFGEHSLEEFGRELVPFGVQMKLFAFIVKDIDPAAVTGAACAGLIMANLANNLPSTESLSQKIFGGGTMSLTDFGTELVAFGLKIKIFAGIVKDVTPQALTGTVTMTKIMIALSENLPDSKSLWSKIFGDGQMTLSEFGSEMVSFARKMNTFSNLVADFNLMQVRNFITGVKELVNFTNSTEIPDVSGLTNFVNQLGSMGIESVKQFLSAFGESNELITTNMFSFVNAIYTALQLGMVEYEYIVTEQVITLCTLVLTQFNTSWSPTVMRTIGSNIILYIIAGINAKKPNILSTVRTLCAAVIKAFKDNLNRSKTFPIGQDAAMGLKEGIESKIDEIAQAAIEAAKRAISAARAALRVASPSKEFFEIGEYVDLGLINGILSMIDQIGDTSEEMADSAINPVKDVVKRICDILGDGGDLDVSPTIVPLVDMSNVEKSAKELQSMFSDPSINVSKLKMELDDASLAFKGRTKAVVNSKNGKEDGSVVNNYYNMEQNNYSPKSLSTVDIYRQTNNLFSTLKKKAATV